MIERARGSPRGARVSFTGRKTWRLRAQGVQDADPARPPNPRCSRGSDGPRQTIAPLSGATVRGRCFPSRVGWRSSDSSIAAIEAPGLARPREHSKQTLVQAGARCDPDEAGAQGQTCAERTRAFVGFTRIRTAREAALSTPPHPTPRRPPYPDWTGFVPRSHFGPAGCATDRVFFRRQTTSTRTPGRSVDALSRLAWRWARFAGQHRDCGIPSVPTASVGVPSLFFLFIPWNEYVGDGLVKHWRQCVRCDGKVFGCVFPGLRCP